MPTFVLTAFDKPNALELRMATRPAHLEYLEGFRPQIRYGGPLVDDTGQMYGSLLVLEVEDRAAMEAFAAGDPFALAGLFERFEIRGLKPVFGQS